MTIISLAYSCEGYELLGNSSSGRGRSRLGLGVSALGSGVPRLGAWALRISGWGVEVLVRVLLRGRS